MWVACSPKGVWTLVCASWDASTPCPGCETLTGPLSLYPYLILSQYLCASFSSCSLMCLCCLYLLSLSFNLFAMCLSASVVLCLPISNHLSLSPPLLASAPNSSLELCVYEGDQILGARTSEIPRGGELHFQELADSQAQGSQAPPMSAQPPGSLAQERGSNGVQDLTSACLVGEQLRPPPVPRACVSIFKLGALCNLW